jgi:hypothetical protein
MALEKNAKDKKSGSMGPANTGDRAGGGAGTKALTGGWGGEVQKQKNEQRQQVQARGNKPSGKPTEGGGPGGGTTTSWNQSPGATGNFPDANAAAVVDMLSSAIPGVGLANSVYKGGKLLNGGGLSAAGSMGPIGDMFGGDPGKQRGYQPDRFKGKASLSNVGDPGSASGEREIMGRSIAASQSQSQNVLTGDGTGVPQVGDDWADVQLLDRRKPRQMLDNIMRGL